MAKNYNSFAKLVSEGFRKLNHWQIDYSKLFLLKLGQWLWDREVNQKADISAELNADLNVDLNVDINADLTGELNNNGSSYLASCNHNALVLRLDGKLGDSIVVTGLIEGLKSKYNQVVVVIPQSLEWFYKKDKQLVTLVYKKNLISLFTVGYMIKKLQRQAPFCVAIDTTHLIWGSHFYFLKACKANMIFGFGKRAQGSSIFNQIINVDLNTEHVTKRYIRILERLNISYHYKYDLSFLLGGQQSDDKSSPKTDDKSSLEELAQKAHVLEDANTVKIRKKYICINFFSAARMRCFSQTGALWLIKYLSNRFKDYELMTLASGNDIALLKSWKEQAGNPPYWIIPELNYFEISKFVKSAELMITPDTSYVHLCGALNVPLLAFYYDDSNSPEKNSAIWAPIFCPFEVVKLNVHELVFSAGIDLPDLIRVQEEIDLKLTRFKKNSS